MRIDRQFKTWWQRWWKTTESTSSTGSWGSLGTIDAYRRQRAPNALELLRELKNTAWSCASVNAAVCASHPPRLYVATTKSQPEARCLRQPISPPRAARLRERLQLKVATIEEVIDHPLLRLLRQVNPVHNSYDLWELTTLYQEVHGSAFWLVEKGLLGIPELIWPLPSQYVTLVRERQHVRHYIYREQGQEQIFMPDQIIHFFYPDPADPYGRGLSPLRACYEQAALTSEYYAFKRATMDNQAIPSAVISPAEVMGEEERDRLEKSWNQKFRRSGAGKVVVAESSLKVDVLSHSMGDLASLAEYGATKEDICNAFHVPMAFLTKDTNMANIQAAHHQHAALAIGPRLRRRDEKINEQLLPLYDPSGRLFVASDDPVPESQDQLLRQQEQDLRLGTKSINEVRAERGLPPVAWGNQPWLPSHWWPTTQERGNIQTIISDDLDVENEKKL